MPEIADNKRLIQQGREHVVKVGDQAREATGTLNNAKGNLAGAAEAVTEVIRRLKLVETDFKTVAGQTRGVLGSLNDARDAFTAAGASSSPFEAIRNMPVDLKGCHDWLEPTADVLEGQEQLTNLIGLMHTIHEDITREGLAKGLGATLGMFNRIENQVAPEIIGRADTWDAML